MTNYFVGDDGIKTTINDDLFDLLWNSIDSGDVSTTDSESSEKIIKSEKKKVYNDRLNEKNRQNYYFKEYFKKNNKCYECERCGKIITSQTNKSKHQDTERCKRIYEERQQEEMQRNLVRKIAGFPV